MRAALREKIVTKKQNKRRSSMAEAVAWIWYDGELVPFESATTHVLTHSLHYGVSAIEGVRAYASEHFGTCVFRLQEHLRRLLDSAKVYRMELPFSAREL